MPQLRRLDGGSEPVLLIGAGLYFLNAVIQINSRGWRDTSWIAWLLLGVSFLLMAFMPPAVRQSLRLATKDRLGLVAVALGGIAVLMLFAGLVAG
jgi:hypothetical protein